MLRSMTAKTESDKRALQIGCEAAVSLVPTLHSASAESPAVFWTAFLSALYGMMMVQLGRDAAHAILATAKRALDNSRINDSSH